MKSLAGARILVGRASHQANALSSALRSQGAEVIEIPFIEIKTPSSFAPLDRALKNLGQYDWLILTSVNGVDAVWARAKRLRLSAADFSHLRIAAIGPATRKAIASHGLKVAVVPSEYVAEAVVSRLRKRVQGKRILLARAKVARDVIPRELRAVGARVDVVEAYETMVPKASRTKLRAVLRDPGRRPHIVTFTSSSTVRNFLALANGTGRKKASAATFEGICFASIGPVTSATLRESGLPVHIEARQYTMDGLAKAICDVRFPQPAIKL